MLVLMLVGLVGAAEDEESLSEPLDLSGLVVAEEVSPVCWRVGAAAGLGLPVDPVSVAPVGVVSVSRALPTWDGRIRPLLSAGLTRTSASGELEDPRLPEVLLHETRLLAVMLGAGLEVALLVDGLSPYLLAEPLLNLSVTTAGGTVAGTTLSETREARASFGFSAGAGILSPLGAGEVLGGIHYTLLAPGGLLAGEDRARSVAPTIGYRWRGGTP
ncbi:MAG: hypothetical protein ACI8RZ_004631 [Myxococcota bacterium]|jgi:hypothetical protein